MSTKRLNAQIVIGGSITGALKGAFATAGKSLTELGSEVKRLSKQQKTLEKGITTFGKMGRNVDGLREKYEGVTRQLEKMRSATERLARIEDARQKNMARRAELRGQIFDTAAVGLLAGAPIKAAIDFESAMADVRKVVDFKEPNGLKNMSKTIVEMSTRLPMAANDIASIVAAGGQAGLSENELAGFAESSIKMGVAFGITADEAGQMMAGMRSAFGMSQSEVNSLADKMNYLANTTSTSETSIASIVQRVGPLAEVAGVSAGQVAALGATLTSMKVQEEVAATGIQNFMLAMVAGESATKKQQEAMAKLGLESSAVAKGMQTDAEGAIMTVLDRLKALPEHMQAATMSDLFGKESIKAIAPLLNNIESLAKNLSKVNDETLYAGAVNKEYESQANTTANKLQLFKNRINALAVNIGNVMLPAVNSLLESIGPIVSTFADLTERFPVLTKLVIGGTTALVAGRIAFLGVAWGMTFVKGAVLALRAALLTNPITAIVAGVATAAYFIYENWEPISAWFKETWGMVKQAASATWDWFKENMGWTPLGLIANNWGAIVGFFGGAWSGIQSMAEGAWEKVKSLLGFDPVPMVKKAWEPVISVFSDMWKAIETSFQASFDWITSKFEWISDKWQKTLDFVGLGGDEEDQGATEKGSSEPGWWDAAMQKVGLADEPENKPTNESSVPSVPAPAVKGSSIMTDNSQINITVSQIPGEDATAMAKRVAEEVKRELAESRWSSMVDGELAQ